MKKRFVRTLSWTNGRKSIVIIAGFLMVGAFQNCSSNKFSSSGSSGESAETSASSTSASGSGSGSVTTSSSIPDVKFVASTCLSTAPCNASFVLQQVEGAAVSFVWHTNDTLYEQAAPAGQPPYGKPNVNYVPTGGTITIASGQTTQGITIQNVSGSSEAVTIGVTMTNCTFGGASVDCAQMFQ